MFVTRKCSKRSTYVPLFLSDIHNYIPMYIDIHSEKVKKQVLPVLYQFVLCIRFNYYFLILPYTIPCIDNYTSPSHFSLAFNLCTFFYTFSIKIFVENNIHIEKKKRCTNLFEMLRNRYAKTQY